MNAYDICRTIVKKKGKDSLETQVELVILGNYAENLPRTHSPLPCIKMLTNQKERQLTILTGNTVLNPIQYKNLLK